jgi:hypothetical protein
MVVGTPQSLFTHHKWFGVDINKKSELLKE